MRSPAPSQATGRSPEETYMYMSPGTVPTPDPSCVDPDTNSRTLTRAEEPESCYMNMSLPAEQPTNSPTETYVDMSHLRQPAAPPTRLHLPARAENLHHDYVNRPRSPFAVPCAASSPVTSHNYQNVVAVGVDPVTTQKLIENVQALMGTVKGQAADILTLKKTVKELKLKVEALEQLSTEEFEYDQ